MTTAAQVKKALRPLVERHDDVAIVGRWLVVKPVRHVFRGVLIDRTSERHRFKPKWCVMHLFEARTFAFFNWGSSQVPPYLFPPYKGLWDWSLAEAVPALHQVIEHEALPKLREIATIDDLMAHLTAYYRQHGIVDKPPLYDWPHRKLIFDVALGRLAAAAQPCTEWVPTLKGDTYFRGDADDHAAVARLSELCRRLEKGDKAGLAALLHEWEAATVKNLKIAHLWEPTPFPLEAML